MRALIGGLAFLGFVANAHAEAKFEVRGRVVDLHVNEPIAGATITAECEGQTLLVQTDAKGNFAISFTHEGDHTLVVNARGYVREYVQHLEKGQSANVRLSRGMTVRGRVLRNADGKAVADAEVVCKLVAYAVRPRSSARTNKDGEFEIEGCPVNIGPVSDAEIRVTHANHLAYLNVGEHIAGDVIDDLVFRVADGIPYEGLVVDADAKPVPNAFVAIFKPSDGGSSNIVQTLNADSSGRFNVQGMSAGKWVIGASSLNGVATQVSVEMKGPERMTIRLPRPEVLSGTVRVGKLPAVGARITSWLRTDESRATRWHIENLPSNLVAYTDENGAYRFPPQTPGPYWIEVEHSRTGKLNREVASISKPVDFEVEASGLVSAEIRKVDGSVDRSQHGSVYAVARDTEVAETLRKGRRNEFDLSRGVATISGLPAGEYDAYFVPEHHPIQVEPRSFTIAAGKQSSISFSMPPTAKVKGRVVDPTSGLPVASAQILVMLKTVGRVQATTDVDGRFVIENVGGTVKLIVQDPVLTDCYQTVAVAKSDVELGVLEIPILEDDVPTGIRNSLQAPCGYKPRPRKSQ